MIALDEKVRVAGQIAPSDLPAIAATGVTLIVNNRPDGEEFGQPTGADIETAARAIGLDYRYIPVAGGFSPDQVSAMAEALDAAAGEALVFCRSGTRSAYLWALARAAQGVAGATLIVQASAAGYDLSPLRNHLLR
ncbi:TIGR01244 family sulfur transferase [Sphingosinicella sp. LHD-64]|uniref:TIGR01244 family sulfur transferase n=1 Tax=Sphingosinicella sp. LHD-64 TaxID=3072139 RepID=UPI00280DF45D|nr:TIGR01244 family sulfur transferase [Sphingosinicella sp. LHD-64]MDQ8757129.1 TIGR01244 family sulfur transferase [Sphingosinicella sp. LHD-64]